MAHVINSKGYYDHEMFRVWPDGTVQHTDEPEYTWLSDDYVVVWAYDEEDALRVARMGGYV